MKTILFDLKKADICDAPELAAMNKCLIVDEGSDNPMSMPELEQRMRGFLEGEYHGVLVRVGFETAGYCLYKPEEAQYGSQPGIYLRQYYIKPEYRKLGLGRAALQKIIKNFFGGAAYVSLDVLECNTVGKAFWVNAGFKPIYLRMKRDISF